MMRCSQSASSDKLSLFLILLLATPLVVAEPATEADCRPLEAASPSQHKPLEYADGLLWEISKQGGSPSYLFGTIHVSDPSIVELPEPVSQKLATASIFVMEALPELEESLKLSQMMFFTDDRTLRNYLDETLFDRTVAVLETYQLPANAVVAMKPWAAFLIMNYPAGEGLPLDMVLLDIARQNGAEVHGLESLSEQGNVFSTLDLESQVRLLLDTVCNYETVKKDLETMKALYLEGDLQKLYVYSNKYSISDEKIYQDLIKRLLTDRNQVMTSRMQTMLERGNAFIAIGAMHLPGEDGVLALLVKRGYTIKSIY